MKKHSMTVGHGWNEDFYEADEMDKFIALLAGLLDMAQFIQGKKWDKEFNDKVTEVLKVAGLLIK